MISDKEICERILREYPLFIIGKDWWDMSIVRHKYKELGTLPVRIHVIDHQVLFRCENLNLYLNIDEKGGEIYCAKRNIPVNVLYKLMDHNIKIHHDTLNIVALERQWKINKIIKQA